MSFTNKATNQNLMELLTVDEVAAMLKVSKRHVYELTKARTQAGNVREHPLPCVRLGSVVRFRQVDVEAWIEKLASKGES